MLRRIIRRAIRHGYKLGQKEPFFHRLVPDLDKAMGEAYPELRSAAKRVARGAEAGGGALRRDAGKRHGGAGGRACLGRERCSTARPCSSSTTPSASRSISPPTSRASAACSVDLRRASRRRWRRSASGRAPRASSPRRAGIAYSGGKTEFRGYETLSLSAKVVALYREGSPVDALKAGESGVVVLDQTPFYAESGGQVGDRGELVGSAGTFAVADTQKIQPEVFGHHGALKTGTLKVGDKVEARVDVRAAPAHHAQSLGDAPHAQGAARGARAARAAEGVAGGRREDALRLLARQAADRGGDPPGGGAGERRDPAQHRRPARRSCRSRRRRSPAP